MGLFDEFIPDPSIACPKCAEGALEGFQGKHSGHALFVWRQGIAHPIRQMVDEEIRWSDEQLEKFRLPADEPIAAGFGTCDSCGYQSSYWVDIVLSDGIWTGVSADGPPLPAIHLNHGWIQCPGCTAAYFLGIRGLYFCEPCKRLLR